MTSQANNAATEAYITAYKAGSRVEPGSVCATSEIIFRSNVPAGKDIFIKALSGVVYIKAITARQRLYDDSALQCRGSINH